jgi:hypothetical protein
MPENQATGGSSIFADDGTASHSWAARCLESSENADYFLSDVQKLNGAEYTMDEERAGYVQAYLDDVRHRAIGGQLFVEYKIDLSDYLGEGQGGTGDAAIYVPDQKLLISQDLKYGIGEKVYAGTRTEAGETEPNPQLALYALGLLKDFQLFGDIEKVLLVVNQPRLGHIDEFEMTVAELLAFGEKARAAGQEAMRAVVSPADATFNPGEKQCRWCRAKAVCKPLAAYVAAAVKMDFDTIEIDPRPLAPRDTVGLSKALMAVPLIEDWCRAVRGEVNKLVAEGVEVIGPDGKPYKFVEGEEGKRAWTDEQMAEGLLLGQLSQDKVYAPRKVITAPQAGKLLDKKATKALWEEIFVPLIKRARGKPILALGSDTRKPYSSAAGGEEFDEIEAPE